MTQLNRWRTSQSTIRNAALAVIMALLLLTVVPQTANAYWGECWMNSHSHGSYNHEKRVHSGGGPGTVYGWYTVLPTGVEWLLGEMTC